MNSFDFIADDLIDSIAEVLLRNDINSMEFTIEFYHPKHRSKCKLVGTYSGDLGLGEECHYKFYYYDEKEKRESVIVSMIQFFSIRDSL